MKKIFKIVGVALTSFFILCYPVSFANATNTNSSSYTTVAANLLSRDGTGSALDVSGTAITLEGWYKRTGDASAFVATYYTSIGTPSYIYGLYHYNGDHFTHFLANIAGGFDTTSVATHDDQNSWHHVAVTWDGSTIQFYYDGAADGVGITLAGTLSDSGAGTNTLRIGKFGGGALFTDGLIDEVRIWNVVRTGAQIAASYNQELTGSETGLVAYYRFNDSPGNLVDSGPNGFTLTNTNTVTFSTDVPFTGAATVTTKIDIIEEN